MADKVRIFDTTLRDGEQSPGSSMNIDEKLTMARQLEKLGVNVIEAGFPVASEGDFEAVQMIAKHIRKPEIAALARTSFKDIDRAWEGVKGASKPLIHTFIATSDIHLERKLRMTREQVYEAAVEAVRRARGYTEMVEFSPEDSTRSDWRYLCDVVEGVIEAGARIVNIPDTVGYTVPFEYAELIELLMNKVSNIKKAIISVHCHNDLGLAVANSLAAIRAGARQVECTVNGIGERAGNTSMEEIVMALKTRKDSFGPDTDIVTSEIYPASRLLTQITGVSVQPNKAVVGANAFAHEAGIHQDGVLKDVQTYEIMTPQSIGRPSNELVLGKHSGRHAFRDRLKALSFELSEVDVDRAFIRFKKLADEKKTIFDSDLEAIVADEILRIEDKIRLVSLNVASGTGTIPVATVELEIETRRCREAAFGDGPVDAAYKAIKKATQTKARLERYSVSSITGGTDAQGEVTVQLEEKGKAVLGQGADTDIIVASAKAYVNALNKLEYRKAREEDLPKGP